MEARLLTARSMKTPHMLRVIEITERNRRHERCSPYGTAGSLSPQT